jgi:hypothetical protein
LLLASKPRLSAVWHGFRVVGPLYDPAIQSGGRQTGNEGGVGTYGSMVDV